MARSLKAFFANAGGSAKNYGYGRGNDTYKHLPFEAADVPDNGYPDGLNAEEAIKQLQALKDTSFFLAVGFYKPHMPFNAPKKYWDMYDPEKIPASEFDHIPVGISRIYYMVLMIKDQSPGDIDGPTILPVISSRRIVLKCSSMVMPLVSVIRMHRSVR